MNAKYRICVIVVLMIGFYHGCGMMFQALAADRLLRVVVLPFQIHSETEMTYLQKGVSEILISRLASIKALEIVEPTMEMEAAAEDLRNAAEKQQVDYVVRGSISIIGKHGSIDAKVISFSGKEKTWVFYRKIDNLDEVVQATEGMAKETENRVFGNFNQAAFAGSETSSSVMNQKKRAAFQSDELTEQVIGIGIGDIDRNGKTEIVAASGHDIHIYQVTESGFLHAADIAGKSYHSYLSVDVADINGNGTAEIYISCEHAGSGALESFVLEWNSGQLVPIQQDQNWYFRVIRTQNGDRLFGQKKGISTAYMPGIYKLLWSNSVLMPASQKEVFPDDIMVFGVSKGFAGRNANLAAAFDSNDRLSIINENGSIDWKSDVPYGGKEQFVKTIEDYSKNEAERFYLPQRTFSRNMEGKPIVIVPFNDSSSGRIFQKFRNFSNARFLFFTWDALGLSIIKRSQDLSGYVSDFCVADVNNDGLDELVYSLVTERESAFRSGKSYIATEDLSGLVIQQP